MQFPDSKKRKSSVRLPFAPEEDQKLLKIINGSLKSNSASKDESHLSSFSVFNKVDLINWKAVSRKMGDRTVRQCKERYMHYLSPSINKKNWTNEEDSLLISSVTRLGKRWKLFEDYFPQRTEIDIRNRYYVLQRRISKAVGSKSVRNNFDIANSAHVILNAKDIYLSIFKRHDHTHDNTKRRIEHIDVDESSDDSFESPNSNINDDLPIKNTESNDSTKNLEDFFKTLSDVSFDQYKLKYNQDTLISFFNGRVYDEYYVNDTTFS